MKPKCAMIPVSARVVVSSNRTIFGLSGLLLAGLALAALPQTAPAQYFPAGSIPEPFNDQTTSGVVFLGKQHGVLGPYANTGYFGPYIHLAHTAGDGPGYRDNGYTTLGLFVPKKLPVGMLFSEGRLAVNDFGDMLGSVGSGYRYFSPTMNRVWGSSFWYDIDGGHNGTFTQVAANFETRGENWDMFGNLYLPVYDDDQRFDRVVRPTGATFVDFVGRNLAANQPNFVIDKFESAMRGGDVEFGGRLPYAGRWGVRGYGGYYFFQKDEVTDVNGGRFRLHADITDSLSGDFLLTHDNVFDTSVIFNITWTLPGSGANRSPYAAPGAVRSGRTVVRAQSPEEKDRVSQRYRMFQPVQRSTRVFVTTRRTVGVEDSFTLLTDPRTGEPIVIAHLDSRAGADGDGSFETPFSNPQEAEDGTGESAVIFAHAGSVFDDPATNFISLKTSQQLLGEGVPHFVATQEAGVVLLPPSGDSGPLPRFEGSAGNAIRLANGSLVSGFTVADSGGAGIFANGSLTSRADVNRTDITGGTRGLFVRNATGTVNFADTTSISGTTEAGIRISGAMTTAEVNFGGTLDVDAGRAIRISDLADGADVNVTGDVTSSGGTGILIEDSAGEINLASADLLVDMGATGVTLMDNPDAVIQFDQLEIDSTVGGTSSGLAAFNSGNLTVLGGNIVAEGGPALLLDGNGADPFMVNVRLNDVTSNDSGTLGGSGVRVENVMGTVAITGTTAITAAGGNGLEFIDSAANLTITELNIDMMDTGESAVFIGETTGSQTGTLAVSGGTIRRVTDGFDTFVYDGGRSNVNFFADINHGVDVTNSAAMVNIMDTTGGAVNFTGTLTANDGTGIQISDAASDATFSGTNTLDGGDAGIDILGDSTGTYTFSADTSIVNPTGDAFVITGDGTNNPDVLYSGTIENDDGRIISISDTVFGPNQITFDSTLDDAIVDSGTGTGIFLSEVGQRVNFTADVELNGAPGAGTAGIEIEGGSGTFTFTDTDIDVDGVAFEINGGAGMSLVTVNFEGDSTIVQDSAFTTVAISDHETGSINFNTNFDFDPDDAQITAMDGDGLQFSNADGIYNFNDVVVLGDLDDLATPTGNDTAVDILDGSDGDFTFASLFVISPTGTAFNVVDSDANIDVESGLIFQVNDAITVNVDNHDTGTIDIEADIHAFNGLGLQFTDADGTYRFDGEVLLDGTFLALGGDTAIDIIDSDGDFTFTDTTVVDPLKFGLNIDGGDGDITFGFFSTIEKTIDDLSGSEYAVNIVDRTGGTIDFNGDVFADGPAAGINITGSTGGTTIRFDGLVDLGDLAAITGDTAVNISGNDNTTSVRFADLNIVTDGEIGLNAENGTATANGGTLTILDGNIDTTDGQGINLDDIDMDITLNDISVDGAGATTTDALAFTDVTGSFTTSGDAFNPSTIFITDGATGFANGINIDGGTANFTLSRGFANGDLITIEDATDNGIRIDGHETGTFNLGQTSIARAGANGILINDTTGVYNLNGGDELTNRSSITNPAGDGIRITEAGGDYIIRNWDILLTGNEDNFGISFNNTGGVAVNPLTIGDNSITLDANTATTAAVGTVDPLASSAAIFISTGGGAVTLTNSSGAANNNVVDISTSPDSAELADPEPSGTIGGTIRINGTDITP